MSSNQNRRSTFVVTESSVRVIGGCMMTLATLFLIARFTIRTIKRRFFIGEEIFISFAWACMIGLSSTFIVLTPTIFRVAAVVRAGGPFDAAFRDDFELMSTLFLVTGLVFWSCLWSVKLALLLQCRRLVDRQRAYTIVWWSIVGVTVVTYLVCVINQLTPCNKNLGKHLKYPGCQSPSERRRLAVTVYSAYALDVLTDLMIIALPIPILLRLRLNLARKLSIMAIFGVAAIAICVATICVARMALESPNYRLSPSWLAVWGIVESAVAVVVGCLPTFGLLLPPLKSTNHPKYGSRTKKSFPDLSAISTSTLRDHTYNMQPYPSKSQMRRLTSESQTRVYMISANGSGDRIDRSSPGVMVTNTFEVLEPAVPNSHPPATLPPAKHALDAV